MTKTINRGTSLWQWNMICVGIANAVAELPQVYRLVTTHRAEGISVSMFLLFLYIQVSFAVQGWHTGDKVLARSCGIVSVQTAFILAYVLYLRKT